MTNMEISQKINQWEDKKGWSYHILVIFFPHTHFRPGNFSPQNYTGGLECFGTFRINCQKIPLTSDTWKNFPQTPFAAFVTNMRYGPRKSLKVLESPWKPDRECHNWYLYILCFDSSLISWSCRNISSQYHIWYYWSTSFPKISLLIGSPKGR